MRGLRDLVQRPAEHPPRVPAWLARLTRIGIVDEDPDVRRRQMFTNIGAYATALNALSHLVVNFNQESWGLMPLHVYNAAVAVIALLLHRLHRYGENLAAIALCTLIVVGHTYVVLALGLDSDLQIYFTLTAFMLFVFGVQNWRLFLLFYLSAFAALMATLAFGEPAGFVIPEKVALRELLSSHALVNTMIINALVIAYALNALRRAELHLANQLARSDALVDIMLPKSISARIKAGGGRRIADNVEGASVLFADLSGFTPAARTVGADELVGWLDALFCAFDGLCSQHGVDKIKTIGDCYMAVGGIDGDAQGGAAAIGRLALSMHTAMERHPTLAGHRLSLRIGIHSGAIVAGVIGDLRVAYDVWGDAVNVAQRMEAHGAPGRIQVSASFRGLAADCFVFERRGTVAVKGMDEMETWFLTGLHPERIPLGAGIERQLPCDESQAKGPERRDSVPRAERPWSGAVSGGTRRLDPSP